MSHFSIIGNEDSLVYKTYITQEMLKRGYLASNAFYTSYAHNKKVIEQYLDDIGIIFAQIGKCIREGKKIERLLEGEVCQSGFGRLN